MTEKSYRKALAVARAVGGSVTDNPNFNNWFSGSAAVDPAGQPMKLYHGTQGDFSSFDNNKIGSNPNQPYSFGHHFTTRPQEASTYADSIANSSNGFNPKSSYAKPVKSGANVMPVYASVKNPLVLHSKEAAASMTADMDRAHIIEKLLEAKKKGRPYDGVIIHRHHGDPEYDHSNVIVFDPRQIKSAIGNDGGFDPHSPDITRSTGGALGDKAHRKALLTVKRLHRAPGGSLSDAINSFSRQRQNALDPPSASAQNAYQGIPQNYFNNFNMPELAIAQPPQEERATPMAQSADLGSALEDGVNWIQGKEGKPKAPSPTNQALEDPTTTSVAPKVASNSSNGGIGINALMNNISNIESGGRYDARGPVTKAGDRAYGRYQVMGANIPQWTKETLGTAMTPQQFLNSPEAQDAVAQQKLSEYWKQYGSPEDAASMWFSGRPLSQGAHLRDQLGTSGADYAARAAQGIQGQPLGGSPQRTAAQQATAAPRGHLQIADPNTDPLTSHAYPAPTERSAPQPTQPLAPPPTQAQGVTTPPPPQLQDATAGPQASADPQSNLYDKVAFMPSVESGYENPQVLYDPTQTAAKGGSIKSMPSPELIARALQILARHRAATGGAQTQTAPTLDSLNTQIQQQAAAQARDEASQNTMLNAQGLQASQEMANQSANGTRYGNDTGGGSPGEMMSAVIRARNPVSTAPQQPTPPPAPITPALQGQTLGNAAGATGAPLGNIPMASPGGNGTGGAAAGAPTYNNTLDEALGTNSPTMNQIFGFNYPVPPPPKPQPQGPVSQNEINALYGYGGGSQMGTGTGIGMYADGGAIVMDALLRANRARKAKGKR